MAVSFWENFGSRGGGRGPLRALYQCPPIYIPFYFILDEISKNNPTIFLKLGMRVYIDKWLGLIGGDFSRTGLGVEIDAKNTLWKRPKIVIFEENRQYLLNGWRYLPRSGRHFCRTAFGTFDRRNLIGLAPTGIEHLAFLQNLIFDFCAIFDILGDFSPRSSRFSAPFVEQKIIARVFGRQ